MEEPGPVDLASLRAQRASQRATVDLVSGVAAILPDPIGHTVPRLYTAPAVIGPPGPCGCGCAHTSDTTYGFGFLAFCTARGVELDPWERWLAIHMGELDADGYPRFRHVLVIVARQNGKTLLLTMLGLYWLFVEMALTVVSMSTNLDYATEAWENGVAIALDDPELANDLPPTPNRGVRRTNGQHALNLNKRGRDRPRWKIAASNRRGGRSLSIDLLMIDELREHFDWSAWMAAVPATNARPGSQVCAFSNGGDPSSVVLLSRRTSSLSGEDPGSFIAEWSMPDEWTTRVHHATDAELIAALAYSNPNLGRRLTVKALLGDARAAIADGGDVLVKFLTEVGCINQASRNPAIESAKWPDLVERHDLADDALFAQRTALVADVALDGLHASVIAARVLRNGRVASDVVASWAGPDCTTALRRELPALVRRVKPWAVGWFPDGGAAAVASQLAKRKSWPPPRVELVEITGEKAAACMGLADLVRNGGLVHPDDELLTAQTLGAERLPLGDRWVFTREAGHCDATYALAGAAHLALMAPPNRTALVAL